MSRVISLSADEQREMLATYLNSEHVIDRRDPLRRKFDRLIGDCLVSEELELGVALIALTAARGVGLGAEAAGAVLSMLANRAGEWSYPAKGGGS